MAILLVCSEKIKQMSKRKFFSQKDGTTLGEDAAALFNEWKIKVIDCVRKFGPIAEVFVNVMDDIVDATREGMPADRAFDFICSKIKGEVDDNLYHFIQDNLPLWVEKIRAFTDKLNDMQLDPGDRDNVQLEFETTRMKTASVAVQMHLHNLGHQVSRRETDTAVQNVFYVSSKNA